MEKHPQTQPPEGHFTLTTGSVATICALFATYSLVFTFLLASAMHFSIGSIIIYSLFPIMLAGLWLAYFISLLIARVILHDSALSTLRCFRMSLLLTLGSAAVSLVCYSLFWPRINYGPGP